MTKAPTAELKMDQKDSDTLPPYEVLDEILKMYIEEDMGIDEMSGKGFKKKLVKEVVGMVDRSEYKRRQSPPGLKITPKSFGKDRRMPITNGYYKE
jgi:NAD+ synthase (glutamine-hydrolysing)